MRCPTYSHKHGSSHVLYAKTFFVCVLQVDDLKEALQEMFKTAGVKGTPLLFLMTDGQIVNERFLIYINDILANGWISDLFPKVTKHSFWRRQRYLVKLTIKNN